MLLKQLAFLGAVLGGIFIFALSFVASATETK